jgi:hypothetical protein
VPINILNKYIVLLINLPFEKARINGWHLGLFPFYLLSPIRIAQLISPLSAMPVLIVLPCLWDFADRVFLLSNFYYCRLFNIHSFFTSPREAQRSDGIGSSEINWQNCRMIKKLFTLHNLLPLVQLAIAVICVLLMYVILRGPAALFFN